MVCHSSSPIYFTFNSVGTSLLTVCFLNSQMYRNDVSVQLGTIYFCFVVSLHFSKPLPFHYRRLT